MLRTLIFALSLAAAPVAAQDAPPRCELHVWPADGMGSVRGRAFDGPFDGGVFPVAIKRSQDNHDAQATAQFDAQPDPMAPSIQTDTLKSLPLAEMLGLPDHLVIIHDVPLDSRTIRTVKTRYVETAAPCYADLVVDDVTYAKAYAGARTLKAFFRFRDFRDQAAPVRSFGTWVDTKLKIFAIDPPNFSQAALDEIVSAYRTNVTLFSDLLRKRP